MTILTSKWDGLNEHLIASIYAVDYNGNRVGDIEVKAPLTEAVNLEATLNWQSPFENAGTDSVKPALTAMLQSGAIQPITNALTGAVSSTTGQQNETLESGNKFVSEFQGRTGMTKLNSTQTFTGMPPLKISTTLLFRAYSDPVSEVHKPLEQLWQWALPKDLADDGTLSEVLKVELGTGKVIADTLKALMPSEAPQLVGFKYKGRTLTPMVIESISEPMESPIVKSGHYSQIAIPVTLATLTALDVGDWKLVSA